MQNALNLCTFTPDPEKLAALFGAWSRWPDRNGLEFIRWPGVYAVALGGSLLSGSQFTWREDIIYFGMSNNRDGLRARLKQFDGAMQGRPGHGGAQRVRHKHRDYNEFCRDAYVSIAPFDCNARAPAPSDLRTMGEIARCEYLCLAAFLERFRRLPEFNDRKRSPKLKL